MNPWRKQLDIFFELENARTSGDRQKASASLTSLLKSAKSLDATAGDSWKIWILRDRDFSPSFLEEIKKIHEGFDKERIQHVGIESATYFGLKNLAAGLGDGDYLIFCDSDCHYEVAYLDTMRRALLEFPGQVIYGATYARESGAPFEQVSALTWLFPPESVGYGDSWPRSKWANNFGLARTVLSEYPIELKALTRFSSIETKQERPIWERETSSRGIVHRQVEARAYHEQFSNIFQWSRRQFIHGLGTSARLKGEGKRFRTISRMVVKPLKSRIRHLNVLALNEVGPRRVSNAVMVLRIGKFVRLIAVVAVWALNIRLVARLS